MMWGHGSADDHGPNNPEIYADDTQDCGEIQKVVSADYLAQQNMGCDDAGENIQATARSLHPGGVKYLYVRRQRPLHQQQHQLQYDVALHRYRSRGLGIRRCLGITYVGRRRSSDQWQRLVSGMEVSCGGKRLFPGSFPIAAFPVPDRVPGDCVDPWLSQGPVPVR